jgi:hypothetical protein
VSKNKDLKEIEQSKGELLAPLEGQKTCVSLFTKLELGTLERLVGSIGVKKYLNEAKDSFTV